MSEPENPVIGEEIEEVDHPEEIVHWYPPRRQLGQVVGAKAEGLLWTGAAAFGALAIGALAIGALAIGRLAIGHARIRHLEIDELTVGKIRYRRP